MKKSIEWRKSEKMHFCGKKRLFWGRLALVRSFNYEKSNIRFFPSSVISRYQEIMLRISEVNAAWGPLDKKWPINRSLVFFSIVSDSERIFWLTFMSLVGNSVFWSYPRPSEVSPAPKKVFNFCHKFQILTIPEYCSYQHDKISLWFFCFSKYLFWVELYSGKMGLGLFIGHFCLSAFKFVVRF